MKRDVGVGEIGVVTALRGNNVIAVLWNNGVESYHSSGWITRISEDT